MAISTEAKYEIEKHIKTYIENYESKKHRNLMQLIAASAVFTTLLLGLGGWALRTTAVDAAKSAIESDPLATEIANANISALKAVGDAQTAANDARKSSEKLIEQMQQSKKLYEDAELLLRKSNESAESAILDAQNAAENARIKSNNLVRETSDLALKAASAFRVVESLNSSVLAAGSTFNSYLQNIEKTTDTVVQSLLNDENFRNSVVKNIPIIPSEAVVAFANTQECPSGWTLFKPASGRTIIGAGEGNSLTNRVPGSVGGAETHTLSIAEMPRHDHGGIYGGTSTKAGMNNGFAYHTSGYERILPEGGGNPHNIMQPYIVLTYCIKDSD